MKIIGLGHYSRTGKSYTAEAIVKQIHKLDPCMRVGIKPFAWKLKQITHELYAWAGLREPEFYETPEGAIQRDVKLAILNLTPIEVWVKFGTDAVRQQVYENTWLDYLLKNDHPYDVLIIPDVRFPNEFDAVRSAGGILTKVVRPGYGPRNTKADRALMGRVDWDYIIGSTGDLDELEWWAKKFAEYAEYGAPLPVMTEDEKLEALNVEAVPVEAAA